MKIKRLLPFLLIGICVVLIAVTLYFKFYEARTIDYDKEPIEVATEPEFLFGICIDSLNVVTAEVKSGETFGALLSRYGVNPQRVNEVVQKSKGVFDLRSFRQGNNYNVLSTMDSLQKIEYFIYEHSVKDYIIIDFRNGVEVNKYEKEVVVERRYGEATINSSLWEAAVGAGMNGALAMTLSDVFQWSIDFYAIQKGDHFRVIYDELFIDGKSVGVGTIWGACFNHSGKDHYAVRYEYTEGRVRETGYWDETGKSLKSAFLKAPLKYSRISSKFTNSRLHPVLRIRRPHHGVDYAAPSGTPVQAIANGVVVSRGYSGGGGNTVKIRHSRGYMSGYLHLKGYGSGLKVGSSVSQGQIIGYVGSTGVSTGPHLDFRIWKNGKPIDPLKMTGEKGEDISQKYKAPYNVVKKSIMAELQNRQATAPETAIDTLQHRLITVPQK